MFFPLSILATSQILSVPSELVLATRVWPGMVASRVTPLLCSARCATSTPRGRQPAAGTDLAMVLSLSWRSVTLSCSALLSEMTRSSWVLQGACSGTRSASSAASLCSLTSPLSERRGSSTASRTVHFLGLRPHSMSPVCSPRPPWPRHRAILTM